MTTKPLHTFTAAERLVLRLVNLGHTDAHIAREMGIHRATVRRIYQRASAKLNEIRELVKSSGHEDLIERLTA